MVSVRGLGFLVTQRPSAATVGSHRFAGSSASLASRTSGGGQSSQNPIL